MSSIDFSPIYTNFGSVCLVEKPLKDMQLEGLNLGGVSEAPVFLEVKERAYEEPKAAICNTDLAMIASVHPHYLLNGKGTKKFGEALEDKHQSVVQRDVKSLPNDHQLGEPNPISLAKAIVLAKTLFLQSVTDEHAAAEKRNHHKIVLCFSGHWVNKDDITGEHAYPSSMIWERLHQVALGVFPSHFKTQNGELNRIAWEAHHFDARNLIGFCQTCNKEKGTKHIITWLKSNPYYGKDFLNSILPLSAHIIPRTKDGQGLGDAMITHFLEKVNSLTLLADAPLLDNSALVMKELRTIIQLSPADIKRLKDGDNAALAEELRVICEELAKKLK